MSQCELKRYRFRYNGDLENEPEDIEEGEMTYHEHLLQQDGNTCLSNLSTAYRGCDGRELVEAFFDDGNELTVYVDELEELPEQE